MMGEKIKIFFFEIGKEGKKISKSNFKSPGALFLILLPLLQICRFPFTNEKHFDWILAVES